MTPRKPRKMPKNQRAYPKGKPRLVEITDANELRALIEGGLGVPFLDRNENGRYYADAEKMRKWRGSRVTSGEQQ